MMRSSILTLSLLVVSACASEKPEAKRNDDTSGAARFSGSDCQSCLVGACGSELDDCSGDPACGSYWNCLGRCALNELGGPDASCEKRCLDEAGALGSVGSATATCLWAGAGAACSACGTIGAPDVTGITDQMCEPSTDPDACLQCEDSHCCETHAACSAEPECGALLHCEQACTNDQCVADCAAAHPTARGLFGARLSCVTMHCPVECGAGTPNACESCVNEGCGDLWVACQSNDECYSLFLCGVVCGADGDCLGACHDEFPRGADAFDAWAVCSVHRCTAECS
jgi:hypothetical protein